MNRIGPFTLGARAYRLTCVGLTALSVGVGGTGAYLASQWNRTTTIDLTEVLDDFREDGDVTTTVPPAGAGAAVAVGADPAVTATTSPTAAPVDATGPAGAPTTPASPVDPAGPAGGGGAPAPGPQGPTPFTRPAEGVYTYAASGGERISVGGARHDFPGEVYATLTHTACGYQLVLHVIQEHIDTLDFCVDGTQLGFHRSHQRMTFLGNTAEGSFACDPWIVAVDRAVGPGGQDVRPCTAGSVVVSSATATHVADEPVPIDGGEVIGSRVTWAWQASGGETTGSGQQTWVFDPDGLPLIIEREGSTTAPSVLGKATHTESARFVLRSRSPQR